MLCSALHIYFCQNPSLNLTTMFLGAFQIFFINALTLEPLSLIHLHSLYCLYYRSCMCSEAQFPLKWKMFLLLLLLLLSLSLLLVSLLLFCSSKKGSELQKVQSLNKKPVSEIRNNLVFLTAPCLQSLGVSFSCKYLSLMSQTIATAFLLNQTKTANRSCWNFCPACSKSFTDMLSFCAEEFDGSIFLFYLHLFLFLQLGNVRETASFCSIFLSDVSFVSICNILINSFLITFTHFWLLPEWLLYMV